MGEANVVRRVAIACQGGGSHTAFTAGVLKRLLRPEVLARYEVVGLSGTSGGAVCALLAWHKLLRAMLRARWMRSMHSGATTPPRRPWSRSSTSGPLGEQPPELRHDAGRQPLRQLFLRSGPRGVQEDAGAEGGLPGIGVQPRGSYPVLLVGAVDVLSGEFRTFNSRRDRISAETILASAAIPTLFRSVRLRRGDLLGRPLLAEPPGK